MNLLIGSTTHSSGKTAIALGLGLHLRKRGIPVRYAKPLGSTPLSDAAPLRDADCALMEPYLHSACTQPLVFFEQASIRRRLGGEDTTDYRSKLASFASAPPGGVCLVEAGGTPQEGAIFGLTLEAMAVHLPAPALLVCRYEENLTTDALLHLQSQLDGRLAGVLLNDVPPERRPEVESLVVPFLESQGIAVLGVLEADTTLGSLSVAELAGALGADVLCCRHRLELMVETVQIGAMSVNAALKYFRTARNKAVITGGDRTDLQLAALETSTSCLVLTGHLSPSSLSLARAEQLEVPVLSVGHDTLSTTGIIDRIFGQARFREPVKVERIQELLARHFDFERLTRMVLDGTGSL